MVNKYVRISERGKWSQANLTKAIEAVHTKNMSVRQASLLYLIPRKTLERRLKKSNFVKGPMGPVSIFGQANENRLVKHILLMQRHSFPVTPKDLRSIAFHFAEQLGLKHPFDKNKEEAGYVWMKSFLKRNPEIRIRKAEGVSLARCEALNRAEVSAYFDMLYNLLNKYNLFDKPSNIFNMDESGLQLNARPGNVLAAKGSKVVSTVTSTEKGETITVIACCNAEGYFLPPACIMKGKNKKSEWQDKMPPGSELYMSQKSAYINAHIFFEWLKTHFLPRKPAGKVLMILDGHASHCNSVEMLEFAIANDIILLTLPSHTTHYLQTLDRSVFKSLKSYYNEAARLWLKNNPGRRLTRYHFGELLSTAWGKAATPENAISGFRATGVYPFNPSSVPDYAFLMNDITLQNATSTPEKDQIFHQENDSLSPVLSTSCLINNFPDFSIDLLPQEDKTPSLTEEDFNQLGTSEVKTDDRQTPSLIEVEVEVHNTPKKKNDKPTSTYYKQPAGIPGIKTHKKQTFSPIELDVEVHNMPKEINEEPTTINYNQPTVSEESPTKILEDLCPTPTAKYAARKRAKLTATELTSEKHVNQRKEKENKIETKNTKTKEKTKTKENTNKKVNKKNKTKIPNKKSPASKMNENDDDCICVGCGDSYYNTDLIEDWIQCLICQRWVHENCTAFEDKCHECDEQIKTARRFNQIGKRH